MKSGVNREAILKRLRRPIERPDVTGDERFVRIAQSLGWVQTVGMGDLQPVPLAAILPAVGMDGSPLQTYRDAETVARMCEAFAAGLREGKEPLSAAPWERG